MPRSLDRLDLVVTSTAAEDVETGAEGTEEQVEETEEGSVS
jgi:hypothetical protein